LILQIWAAMKIEEFGSAPRVLTREWVGGDVVDFCVADPNVAAIVQLIEIVLARSQHCDLPVTRASVPDSPSQ